MNSRSSLAALLLAASLPWTAAAQVYSPKVLVKGQPDTTDLAQLAKDIYAQSGARTPRERAEAIWRFFNTDGRFVKPGFWYHIAGWAYEEPMGELLDPMKLLNSYGFGLCYQIAPVLEAVFKAGGFEDARTWFLTGHTVTEVFYDGAYHHYDSDMMGYTVVGKGPVKDLPVASVHQLEQDGSIILSKLAGPRDAIRSLVDDPWYPADVREGAMGGLAELFTTTRDNWLYAYQRYPQGHAIDFVLRPGERLVRYFQPQGDDGGFYLPHMFDGKSWREFADRFPQWVRAANGPRSEKDARRWGTGLLEYHPPLAGTGIRTADGGMAPAAALPGAQTTQIIEVRSPYVIIDATFDIDVVLSSDAQSIAIETSTDDGRRWVSSGSLRGPHKGPWKVEPAAVARTAHSRRSEVSGRYQYLVRVSSAGGGELRDLRLDTRIQINPRTLPALAPGRNELVYAAGPARVRRELAVNSTHAAESAIRMTNARYLEEKGQGYWVAAGEGPAEMVFRLSTPGGGSPNEFDAGGRFLDLTAGLAPDKYTAEVRKVAPWGQGRRQAASIAWGASPDGPFQTIWEYNLALQWKDGQPIDRLLRWPEVDRHVTPRLPRGARDVYVRYRMDGLALDDIRLATESGPSTGHSPVEVTHLWRENGVEKKQTQRIADRVTSLRYSVDTTPGAQIVNEAVVLACPRQ